MARLYSPSYLRYSTSKSSSSTSTVKSVFVMPWLLTFGPILHHTHFPMCIQRVWSCECFWASGTSKLAINSFNSMNRSSCIRNTHQCLTDITKVVIAFSFSVEHYITSSTIICGRHFYFWLLVRLWLLWAIGYDDRKLWGKKGNFILFRHGESYLIRTIWVPIKINMTNVFGT